MKTLICVDIQPEFKDYFSFDIYNFTAMLNKACRTKNKVILFFVGKEFSCVSEEEYKFYLYEYGLKERNLEKITFIEKQYGYFRWLMDENYDSGDIAQFIDFMVANNITDSRNFTEENWIDFHGLYEDNPIDETVITEDGDMVYIPDFYEDLKSLDGEIILCGGGRNECLQEIEIALMSLGKKFQFNREFVY